MGNTYINSYEDCFVSDTVAARRLKLAGYCLRHPELPVSSLVLWESTPGRKSQGWPAKTMVDALKEDTGMANTGKLKTLMQNHDEWRVWFYARQKSKEQESKSKQPYPSDVPLLMGM